MRELPLGWVDAALSDFCDVIQGQSPPSSTYNTVSLGLPFFQGKADFGAISPVVKTWCTAPAKTAQRSDVLLSIRAPVGPANLAAELCAIGRGLCAIRARGGVEPLFILYALHFRRRDLKALATGSTFEAVAGAHVRGLRIPLPPLAEQRRIVAEIEKQLSELDGASSQVWSARRKLSRYSTAVLGTLICTPHLASGALPKVPSTWSWAPLSDLLIDIEAGKSFKCDERPPGAGETGVLKVSAVTWGAFDELESKTCMDPTRISEKLLVRCGDFLFSRANTIELVGACVIVHSVSGRVMLSDKILRFRTRGVDDRWLLYVLRSPWGRYEIERLSTGNQESMRNIGQERIGSIGVPLPPLEQQKELVEQIECAMSGRDQLEAAVALGLSRANRLRQAILAKAFSGQLVPQDPNDEPASVLLERIRSQRASESKKKPVRRRKAAANQPELALES